MLDLYTSPSESSKSLGRYYTGVQMLVLERVKEWAKVEIGPYWTGRATGYMENKYLVYNDRPKYASVPSNDNRGKINVGDGRWLGLKSSPSDSADIVNEYPSGMMFTIMGVTGDWYHTSIGSDDG